jgi:hypothetical protein
MGLLYGGEQFILHKCHVVLKFAGVGESLRYATGPDKPLQRFLKGVDMLLVVIIRFFLTGFQI